MGDPPLFPAETRLPTPRPAFRSPIPRTLASKASA